MELSDLGLTISQLNEVNEKDLSIVAAWLAAASQSHVRNPGGFFWAGIRSGSLPLAEQSDRTQAVLRAERWIERVGLLYDREEHVDDELFGDRGMLREHANDPVLRARMLVLWHQHRPRGEQTELDQRERAARNAKAYHSRFEETG